jgi:probable rRNA maturation factor
VIPVANRQRQVALKAQEVRALVRAVFRAEGAGEPDVGVQLVNDRTIAELNERWLAHEGPTDVIAFGYDAGPPAGSAAAEPMEGGPPPGEWLRGEVVASAETARREAAARGLDAREELLLYVAHGVLHLLGWDDDTPARRRAMNARARALVRRQARGGASR